MRARVQSVICWVRVQVLGWGEGHTYDARSRCLALKIPSMRHKRAVEVVLRSYVTGEGQTPAPAHRIVWTDNGGGMPCCTCERKRDELMKREKKKH